MADYLAIARRALERTKAKSEPESYPAGESQKTEAAAEAPDLEVDLKGRAIELWSDSLGRLFIVADDEDAELAILRWNVQRGEVWTGAEIELIARIEDPEARLEVAQFKRTFSGTVAGAQATGRDRGCNRPAR